MQGEATVLPRPQSIRIGRGDKQSFEKKLKCDLKVSCGSHIFHSSTFPRTGGFLKGYMETQHDLPRLFTSIKYCITGLIKVFLFIKKHWILPFLVLLANDSYSLFPLGFPKIGTIRSRPWFFFGKWFQHLEDELALEKHIPLSLP